MGKHQRWIGAGVGLLMAACNADATPDVASDVAFTEAPLRAEREQRCRALSFRALGTYRTGTFDEGAAEIVAHDPQTQRLFVVNAAAVKVDVLDAADPSAPASIGQLDLASYGGAVTSVAVHAGVVAVAVPAETKTDPGHVVFVNSADLSIITSVRVGALPDMLSFSPNGRYVLVANEGEPSDDYLIDPEGSVSIIDLARGVRRLTQNQVRTAGFGGFARSDLDPSVRVYGPNATPAQDFEPEYLTISEDSRTAWVTLQENNAVAEVNIRDAEVTRVFGLGWKDYGKAGQGFDPSDADEAIAIASWPVLGMYQPDAIASYRAGGRTYLITANEGEGRDYEGFSDEARVADLVLDPEVFPDAAALQVESALGRLKVTNALGDDDGDGDFDALYAFGARSFSIRSASGELVFDSGDRLERITAERHPDNFNADNTDNAFDGRSDDKGPEPEGVTIGELNRRTYAFVGLERIGSVAAYDVTNPRAPCLAGYLNARDFAGDPELDAAGDLGPEGLAYISAEHSPNHRPLLVVANEVSGSTAIYELRVSP